MFVDWRYLFYFVISYLSELLAYIRRSCNIKSNPIAEWGSGSFDIKTFSGIEILMVNIKWSWEHLILITGIHILIIRYFIFGQSLASREKIAISEYWTICKYGLITHDIAYFNDPKAQLLWGTLFWICWTFPWCPLMSLFSHVYLQVFARMHWIDIVFWRKLIFSIYL